MRLIDADALLEDARRDKAIGACLADIVDVQRLVETQPTVDAVPVVRCKDCKYWMDDGEDVTLCAGETLYARCGQFYDWCLSKYDYCSCGERKEE